MKTKTDMVMMTNEVEVNYDIYNSLYTDAAGNIFHIDMEENEIEQYNEEFNLIKRIKLSKSDVVIEDDSMLAYNNKLYIQACSQAFQQEKVIISCLNYDGELLCQVEGDELYIEKWFVTNSGDIIMTTMESIYCIDENTQHRYSISTDWMKTPYFYGNQTVIHISEGQLNFYNVSGEIVRIEHLELKDEIQYEFVNGDEDDCYVLKIHLGSDSLGEVDTERTGFTEVFKIEEDGIKKLVETCEMDFSREAIVQNQTLYMSTVGGEIVKIDLRKKVVEKKVLLKGLSTSGPIVSEIGNVYILTQGKGLSSYLEIYDASLESIETIKLKGEASHMYRVEKDKICIATDGRTRISNKVYTFKIK